MTVYVARIGDISRPVLGVCADEGLAREMVDKWLDTSAGYNIYSGRCIGTHRQRGRRAWVEPYEVESKEPVSTE